jgi:hypothetical protein
VVPQDLTDPSEEDDELLLADDRTRVQKRKQQQRPQQPRGGRGLTIGPVKHTNTAKTKPRGQRGGGGGGGGGGEMSWRQETTAATVQMIDAVPEAELCEVRRLVLFNEAPCPPCTSHGASIRHPVGAGVPPRASQDTGLLQQGVLSPALRRQSQVRGGGGARGNGRQPRQRGRRRPQG